MQSVEIYEISCSKRALEICYSVETNHLISLSYGSEQSSLHIKFYKILDMYNSSDKSEYTNDVIPYYIYIHITL